MAGWLSGRKRMNKYLMDQTLYCEYCNKQCKNRNSLVQHQIRCKNNPARIKCGNPNNLVNYTTKLKSGSISIWNKGKTKYSSNSIQHAVDSLQKTIRLKHANGEKYSTGKAKTNEKEQERRQKISNTMKKNCNAGGIRLNSGKGKKGWYKGIYCRSTYELVYVIYNIDHNIEFAPCKRIYLYEYNNEQHKYYPDFELADGTIIEIKGYANKQTEAKINSVKDRPIKVLYWKDLQYAFDYVKSTYKYDSLEDLYE